MEKFDAMEKLCVVANNNGRLGAIGNCDGKFRRSRKLSATVGNSKGRRLIVRRNNSSKNLVCSELQKNLSNG
jgi:hypothetical protein